MVNSNQVQLHQVASPSTPQLDHTQSGLKHPPPTLRLRLGLGLHPLLNQQVHSNSWESRLIQPSAPLGELSLAGRSLLTTRAGTNVTIDDADPQVVYTGFTSTPANQSPIPAIQSGAVYQNTISYTSSAQASASLTFTGTVCPSDQANE